MAILESKIGDIIEVGTDKVLVEAMDGRHVQFNLNGEKTPCFVGKTVAFGGGTVKVVKVRHKPNDPMCLQLEVSEPGVLVKQCE